MFVKRILSQHGPEAIKLASFQIDSEAEDPIQSKQFGWEDFLNYLDSAIEENSIQGWYVNQTDSPDDYAREISMQSSGSMTEVYQSFFEADKWDWYDSVSVFYDPSTKAITVNLDGETQFFKWYPLKNYNLEWRTGDLIPTKPGEGGEVIE